MSADNTGIRYIPLGACTWCGHQPHDQSCRSTIRTGKATSATCQCTKRKEAVA